MPIPHVPDTSIFNKPRHIKYWLRCLKTHLPTLYQSNDASRMTLAFFIISALDLLDALESSISADERSTYAEWIYSCQHSGGGFRGFTGANTAHVRNARTHCWDPANLAATYFALATLVILKDDLSRVRRTECLQWLRRLQLEDGSFGELREEQDRVNGGSDVRFGYCAASVRWILRRGMDMETTDMSSDIDVGALARSVSSLGSYEGGLGNLPFQEANAGWTYCGIGTLALLGKLPGVRKESSEGLRIEQSLDPEQLLHWLVSQQTNLLHEDAEYEISDTETTRTASNQKSNVFQVHVTPPIPLSCARSLPVDAQSNDLLWAGFSGRCNKTADTCYSFWNGGALAILSKIHLIDFNANRRYLLEKTQHVIGGFGKLPGDPPDIMHSYLGLAALACMREPELKSIDPALCFSVSARDDFKSKAAFTT